MPNPILARAAGLAAVALLAGAPALAQKAKDTFRVAFHQPISYVDTILNPSPETTLMAEAVTETLIRFDARTRSFQPLIAESWQRLDPTTIELKLRRGIKFHDGSELDADDVVYTITWMIDPKNRYRFKGTRTGWIKGAERVDKYTVRLLTKAPFAPALSRLAASIPVYPSDYHSSLANKADFGKAPIGTGPYKVTSIDSTEGVTMIANAAYHGPHELAPKIGTVRIIPQPDEQTRVAEFLTGGLDLLWAVSKDQAENLIKDDRFVMTVLDSVSFSYMYFDTANKSGIGVFKDKRVREALAHAVNPQAIKQALLPRAAQHIKLLKGMCHPWHIACHYTTEPVGYDPAEARRLLAAAGLAEGFDLELISWGTAIPVAEAVAGQLRAVGVRAKVDRVTFGVYNKKRRDGQVQTFVSFWDNGGAVPDVDTTAGFFFLPGIRNYMNDPEITAVVEKGRQEFDLEKRKAIYAAAFDKINREHYMVPLIPFPAVMVHTRELALDNNHKSPEGFLFNRMAWK